MPGGFCMKGATRMAHKQLRFFGVVVAAMVLAMACGGSTGSPPAKTYKIGVVTDIGGLNDKRFKHLAEVGLQKGKSAVKVPGGVKERKSGGGYIPNLTE